MDRVSETRTTLVIITSHGQDPFCKLTWTEALLTVLICVHQYAPCHVAILAVNYETQRQYQTGKKKKNQTWRGLTYSRLTVWLCVTLKPPAQRPSHPLGSLTPWPGTHQYAQCEPSVRPGRYRVVDSLQHAHNNQWCCLFKATVSVIKEKVSQYIYMH